MRKYNSTNSNSGSLSKLSRLVSAIAIATASVFAAVGAPLVASAASTITVTPANQQGWSTADTRPGGNVNFVSDSTAPAGAGALQLTTDATTAAKAQYLHAASVALGSVSELSYDTKQNSASFVGGDPSYQLPVFLNATSGFTTFVYEPYQNGTVTPGVWQSWDVDQGKFWSSRTVTCSNGIVIAGGGGAPFYTLTQIKTMCPSAQVLGFGVNIGSNNPSYDVETDLVSFNNTAYNFEPLIMLTNKDDCKKGGWMTSTNPVYKNQGECVSYFASKGKHDSADRTSFTYGSVTLSGPLQQLNFSGIDNGASLSDTGSVTYSNPSATLTYTAPLTCVNVAGATATFAYVIPAPSAYAGTWVVWKVVDGTPDTAGFVTAADMASANALCESGSFTPTNYTIAAGDIVVQ